MSVREEVLGGVENMERENRAKVGSGEVAAGGGATKIISIKNLPTNWT
jgi:hypothetical protein